MNNRIRFAARISQVHFGFAFACGAFFRVSETIDLLGSFHFDVYGFVLDQILSDLPLRH